MQLRRPVIGLFALLLLSFVLAGCLALFGPREAEVTGTVKYADGKPVPNALVRLGSLETTTGANGAFKFAQKVKHGTYQLTVVVDGEEVHKRQVQVSGATYNIAVELPLDHCWEGPNPPAGMTLVLCVDGREGDTLEDIGFTVGGPGDWSIAEYNGRTWFKVNETIDITWAAIEVPEMATASRIVVEFTGVYTATGNTWGLLFPDHDPGRAHVDAYMVLSAWDAIYLRPYGGSTIITTYKNPPKLEQNVPVTVRVEYDRTAHTLKMWRNGQLVTTDPALPGTLPEKERMDNPDGKYLKLYANRSGSENDPIPTTALWTDIRVWVD